MFPLCKRNFLDTHMRGLSHCRGWPACSGKGVNHTYIWSHMNSSLDIWKTPFLKLSLHFCSTFSVTSYCQKGSRGWRHQTSLFLAEIPEGCTEGTNSASMQGRAVAPMPPGNSASSRIIQISGYWKLTKWPKAAGTCQDLSHNTGLMSRRINHFSR